MSDPRNVAHKKKVAQEKQHEHAKPSATKSKDKSNEPDAPAPEHAPDEHEKSVAILSKLKEMEFHSRANIETLAGLSLAIEDELKQKEFSGPVGDLYSAQDKFQTQIAAFIERYEAKCESMKPSA